MPDAAAATAFATLGIIVEVDAHRRRGAHLQILLGEGRRVAAGLIAVE